MKRLMQLLLLITVCRSPVALAQKSTQEILNELELRNRAVQIEMDLRRQKIDAEIARQNLERDRMRLQADQFQQLYEAQNASDRAREMAKRAEQAAEEQAEALRLAKESAEEQAEELRTEIELSGVRTRNYLYLAVLTLSVGGFIWHAVHKSKNEEFMNDNQKFGVAVVVCSILAMILAFMLSGNWVYRFDFLQNLMTSLQIQLFTEEGCTYNCSYLIDFPTKYAVLACLCGAAYGFTTYIGVTSAPKLLRKNAESENPA